MLSLVAALLNMALKCARVKWLEQLKAAQQFCVDGHDSTPVVEFATVLKKLVFIRSKRDN